jgi:hypothetical protein
LSKWGREGMEGWDCYYSLFSLLIFKIVVAKMNSGGGEADCFMLSYFFIVFCLSLLSIASHIG